MTLPLITVLHHHNLWLKVRWGGGIKRMVQIRPANAAMYYPDNQIHIGKQIMEETTIVESYYM